MRIISETGKFDVPYEHAVVTCDGTMIYVSVGKECRSRWSQYH